MFRDFLGSVVQSEILGCEGSTRNHGNSRIMGTPVFISESTRFQEVNPLIVIQSLRKADFVR